MMDYDYWLQKSAGCFDDYYEASDDEIFRWYDERYSDVPMEKALGDYDIPSCVADAMIDKMWEDEEFLRDYDYGFVEDLAEWMDKYPDKANRLYQKLKPKNSDEMFKLLGRKGWSSFTDEFYDWYNNYYDPEDYRY